MRLVSLLSGCNFTVPNNSLSQIYTKKRPTGNTLIAIEYLVILTP